MSSAILLGHVILLIGAVEARADGDRQVTGTVMSRPEKRVAGNFG